MDEIKKQSRDRGFNSFHFSFSGGEPTLHPGLIDLLQHYSLDLPQSNYQSTHLTTNLSAGEPFWEKYVSSTQKLHRVSITASWHREAGMNNMSAHQKRFSEKLIYLQKNDIQTTINMVMVPQWFDEIWNEALYFHEQGLNVTLKPQSNQNATHVVDGYTPAQLERLHIGMPQRDFTSVRLNRDKKNSSRPKFEMAPHPQWSTSSMHAPQTMQVELQDDSGKFWFLDQAERFNAFSFNRFEGWLCESGYRSIIIREPDGSVKRAYSCKDAPLGNIETGFTLFNSAKFCTTPTCVSSADSKIPKFKPNNKQIVSSLKKISTEVTQNV